MRHLRYTRHIRHARRQRNTRKAKLRKVLALIALAGLGVTSGPQLAAGTVTDTRAVFGRFAPAIGKIEIAEIDTAAKSVIGTAFYVSTAGHLITNYHVISDLVHAGERHTASLIDHAGQRHALAVLAVDVVNDLAVVKAASPAVSHFRLEEVVADPAPVAQGARLYSLGFPHDLGVTIVEGTYNGLLENTLYPKIHFTGSINPGMSGGPAITGDGRVVGVNVATAGDQVSFLVPGPSARELLAPTLAAGFAPPPSFLPAVRSQLLAHQARYREEMLAEAPAPIRLGPYELPGKLAPFFDCWGETLRDDETPYAVVTHECATDDSVYISENHSSGLIRFQHRLLQTDELNRFRFYSLFTESFSEGYGWLDGSAEDVTPFRCSTDFVGHAALTFKTVFCARAHRKLAGLYDAVLKAAALGRGDVGVETTLILAGVSFDTAQVLAARYLGAIAWKE